MTDKQRSLALSEAPAYTDPDAFVSDMLLSAAFLPPDDPDSMPDLSASDELRRLWRIACAPFRDLLDDMGLSQSSCSRRFAIPLRTVQGWALGERACPVYVRLMMAQLTGLC